MVMVTSRDISTKERSDIRTLMRFVGIYCREHHGGEKAPFSMKQFDIQRIEKKDILLCQECRRLLAYGLGTIQNPCARNVRRSVIKETTGQGSRRS
jgi:tRNA 2-selenouridine synthase SelU